MDLGAFVRTDARSPRPPQQYKSLGVTELDGGWFRPGFCPDRGHRSLSLNRVPKISSGLVPAIPVFLADGQTWMPASRPGITNSWTNLILQSLMSSRLRHRRQIDRVARFPVEAFDIRLEHRPQRRCGCARQTQAAIANALNAAAERIERTTQVLNRTIGGGVAIG